MLSDRCLSVCPVCPVLSVTLVYCGQTVEWINIKLGMQVGLGPGHIVLDGDPAPQRGTYPIFSPCLLWPNDRQSQLLLGSCYATLKRYKEFKIANVKFS